MADRLSETGADGQHTPFRGCPSACPVSRNHAISREKKSAGESKSIAWEERKTAGRACRRDRRDYPLLARPDIELLRGCAEQRPGTRCGKPVGAPQRRPVVAESSDAHLCQLALAIVLSPDFDEDEPLNRWSSEA